MPSEDHFDCGHCDNFYTRKFNLEEHIRIVHNGGDQCAAKCRVCGKDFKRIGDCKRHEQLQHRSDRKFICGALTEHNGKGCGKPFARRDALLKHRLSRKKQCIDRIWNQHRDTHHLRERTPREPTQERSHEREPRGSEGHNGLNEADVR